MDLVQERIGFAGDYVTLQLTGIDIQKVHVGRSLHSRHMMVSITACRCALGSDCESNEDITCNCDCNSDCVGNRG